MNKTSDEKIINEQDSHQQTFYCYKDLQPRYEFYGKGLNEVKISFFSSLLAFLENRNGGEIVTAVSIIFLSLIAKEFISNRNDGFDCFALIGSLTIALMIFILALIPFLRAIKFNHAKNTQEQQSEKTQLGISRKCTNKNGVTTG